MSLPVLPPVVEVGKPRSFNANYVLLWNNVALDLVRLVHSLSGQQSGPPLTARALGILHLAIHDAYFAVFPYKAHEPHNPKLDDILPYLSTTQLQQAEKMSPNPTASPIATSADRSKASKQAMSAVAGAAVTVFNKLYVNPEKKNANTSTAVTLSIGGFINAAFMSFVEANNLDLRSGGYQFGIAIARVILSILEIPASQPGTDAGTYMPNSNVPYFFDDDPSHPVRPRFIDPNDPEDGTKATRPYEGPFYGPTAAVFATTKDFKLADPPVDPRHPPNPFDFNNEQYRKYLEAVEDVHRMGGIEELTSTKRRPGQTMDALFWAYDGANLIGTPLRLYNQILRQVAFDRRVAGEAITSDQNNAEIVRLFALANTAMADAGIYCWRDEYHYELWRPLSGVRQDPTPPVPDGFARPFFKVLGAPATNSNESGFKPPFPSYPSGHATFAAAGFHALRLFYNKRGDKVFVDNPAPTPAIQTNGDGPQHPVPDPGQGGEKTTDPKVLDDSISFSFISDELNGISRELYQTYDPSRPITDQPGDVRTRRIITFPSMKSAIFANAISRIWLGVHWNFDAFDAASVEVPYKKGEAQGKDNNLPQPKEYPDIQLFAVEKDGSTTYKKVSEMDWFATKGMRDGQGPRDHFIGGVPLGMLIAESIFDSGMRFEGSLGSLGNPVPRGMARFSEYGHPAASSNALSPEKGTIHIYIDNSNLWMQGQKTYAEKKGFDVTYDPTWRFDVGRLKTILTGKSNLQGKAKNFEVKVHLYGSTPPPVDTVWEAMESHDVQVSTFARSTWSGREKQVDMAMGVQSGRQALKDKMRGIESEFIFVSGDRDLYSAVSAIVDDGTPVHVWSWNNCLAGEYRRKQHGLVQVYLLDDYLEQIGFHETIFRVERNTISPHSIVVLEPLSRADEISSFVSSLNVPVHRYECPTQREGALSKDLVFIPSFARSMTHSDLANLFNGSKAKLEVSGLRVMTYHEYGQRFFRDHPTCELAISNRFAELPDMDVGVEGREGNPDDCNESLDDDCAGTTDANEGFTEVNRSEKQMKKSKKDERSLRNRCHWGFYCPREVACNFGTPKTRRSTSRRTGIRHL